MTTRVSSILAEIGIDSSKFTQGAKGVLGGIGDMIGGLGETAGILGVVVGAFGELYKWMDMSEQAAVASAKEQAKLNAVLESTRGISGMTKGGLQELNQEISKNAGLDDEMVSAGEAVLLTFTQIGKQVFPDTMKAAADMAAVLGGDLQGKVTMIGKAMNDFSGYTSLKRAGVSFTEEQISQINNFKETNDLMGYQKLILGELQTEYGGAAKAINDAGDGEENLKVAQENLNEAMGTSFIPIKRAWNEFWTNQFEGLTKTTEKMNSYDDALKEVAKAHGMNSDQMARARASSKDFNAEIEQEIIDAKNAKVASDNLATGINGVGGAAQLTDEEIQAMNETMTKSNESMISQIGDWTSTLDDFNTKILDLNDQQTKKESELATARAQGYSETGEKIQGYLGELDDIKGKIDEVKRQEEIKTRSVILGYIQQKFAADGLLDDKETAWLIAKGVEWGIYSDNAVQAYKDAMSAANDYVNTYTNMPDKDITITTYYNTVTSSGTQNTSSNTANNAYIGKTTSNRASGGPTSGLTWVGEQGPELLDLPGGSYVNNNNVSKNMANTTQTPVITDDQMRSFAKLTQTDWGTVGLILQNAVRQGMQTR